MGKTIGFVGAGNMGKAMMGGIVKAGIAAPQEIVVYDVYLPSLDAVQTELGVTTASNEKEVMEKADIVILAVKPNMVADVLNTIKGEVSEDKLIVSIAAGVTLERLSANVPEKTKIVRVMPNTPALVGEGMSALSCNSYVTKADQEELLKIFNSFGEAEIVSDYLMDVVTGLSGSGPAFVYMFIEALADGAVAEGMSRANAYKFAAQTVLGSAKVVLETGKHPGELKDMVSSPGGTTIAGVKSLENDRFRAAVMNAVVAATEKSRAL
ncbi:pyrroline-5-carboxylate reductase [Bacillus tuaregi]|uniref:pyrroline-5-carboxylate reductase n=1 Tax=Bacillus tuaregi TaxID=1816695 RepID=UPI0008F9736A|nr:pyrroline-5-carboxylate reductase [Bacillus tuaregi]